ncbi:MAG: heavy metal translocating P-type ATPase [Daejeonella sp.]|uniref:heavy metal translocating P-type ATPase n=1 Tax=Daejeonella sp. TaxID=2805397 RepID=UPI003C75ED63
MKSKPSHAECCSHDPETETEFKNEIHSEHDGHDHESTVPEWKSHWDLLLALLILIVSLTLEYGFDIEFPTAINLSIYGIAYLLAGWNVLYLAFRKVKRFDLFNEFSLMSIATIGAFLIGEYSEGVAVMVFYSIGEWFQDSAVRRARRSIKALLDIRPGTVTVIRNGREIRVSPRTVELGEIIIIKPGEKAALDGKLISESASFNTAALTGESKPDSKYAGELILAGMINLNTVAQVSVTALFGDTKLSQILSMVQDATARKSQTQLFVSKFAKVYTPVVFFLALSVCLLPYFFVDNYEFNTWFYRSLVFLVISCPCALVVSIPLGYFGGIGLASKNGILFKGGNFLDVMTKINLVVMDKTGTLTKGVFKVQKVFAEKMDENEMVRIVTSLEMNSTHPVARAIVKYAGDITPTKTESVEEIAGQGLIGLVDGRRVLAGNTQLLKKYSIGYPQEINESSTTKVHIAVDHVYAGYITIADEIKDDSAGAIKSLHALNIKTVMLSGDSQSVVDEVASILGINSAYGDLLPENKVQKVEELKKAGWNLAFVGDGINDAPVLALADAGIAMGGLGSDVAIETADIVIQNDKPSKIVDAILIGKITRKVVWQNIILAMVVKVSVLALGAGGIATLWEAVIADVGVALLAIMNAVRIQRMKL